MIFFLNALNIMAKSLSERGRGYLEKVSESEE